jgi:predicted esterase
MSKEKSLDKIKTRITRREMLLRLSAVCVVAAPSCRSDSTKPRLENVMIRNSSQLKDSNASREGKILSRPSIPTKPSEKLGLHSMPVSKNREALLYLPEGYKSENPAPFALMLHGAGGNARQGIDLIRHLADEAGMIIAASKSQASTWDMIASDYGADVEFIDRVFEYTFERYAIDKSRLAVGGFSDGASYALSLGVINGDLFSHVIAFSPGFMAPTKQTGKPRFYISHGTHDSVLPIERCSRRLVPQLKRAGYEVIYREFEGPHTIPPDITREAVQWFIKTP